LIKAVKERALRAEIGALQLKNPSAKAALEVAPRFIAMILIKHAAKRKTSKGSLF